MSEHVEHVHMYVPSEGTVSVELEKNSRGYNWKIRIERPIDKGQTALGTGMTCLDEADALNAEIKRRLETGDATPA